LQISRIEEKAGMPKHVKDTGLRRKEILRKTQLEGFLDECLLSEKEA
jgi:hypothetical protein